MAVGETLHFHLLLGRKKWFRAASLSYQKEGGVKVKEKVYDLCFETITLQTSSNAWPQKSYCSAPRANGSVTGKETEKMVLFEINSQLESR